jgi:DNA-binding transcriptional LysR family regulator
MELRQLKYLLDVIDAGSFTQAAANAHVAQPGVSAQIRQLERELGQTLLDRTGRTVRPTPAGAAIVPYARTVLNALDGIRQTTDELAGLVRGHLTLGMVASISTLRIDLPALLAGFHREYPGIEITLTEDRSDQLLTGVRNGHLDLAFIGVGPDTSTGGLDIHVVASEPVVIAVSAEHPLARRRSVSLTSIREHALITLPRGTGLRSRIDAAFHSAGYQPRITFEASDPRLLATLARHGLGAAIIPASAAKYEDELHVLTLTNPGIDGHIALVARADGPASPTTKAFLQHATATPQPVDPIHNKTQ